MKTPTLCDKSTPVLVALIERGEEPSEDVVEHWKTCPDCQRLVVSAQKALSVFTSPPPVVEGVEPVQGETGRSAQTTELAKQETRIRARRAIRKRGIWASVILCFSIILLLIYWLDTSMADSGTAAVALLTFGALSLAILPLALARVITTSLRNCGFFKRLYPGYQLSGVCLGIAERTKTSVFIWRMVFILLTLLKGYGITIYILLALLMPLHPEDRQYLFGFRLARWWRRHILRRDLVTQ